MRNKSSNFLTTLIILTFSVGVCLASKDGKCRALALRGGGAKGAFEVGVLKGMEKYLRPEDYQYDVITGVSIGAVNAAVLSSYPTG